MANLSMPLRGVALFLLVISYASHAQNGAVASGAPALSSGGTMNAPVVLAQVTPSPLQRVAPAAGTTTGASQAGAAANQNSAIQGRVPQGGVNQSSGNPSDGNQASGAPMRQPSPADAAPLSAMPPAVQTPAPPAPAATPPAQPAVVAPAPPPMPPPPAQPAGASGGSAVVVVPEGAKRIAPQVTLRGAHSAARDRQRTPRAPHIDKRHAAQSREAKTRGDESTGTGQ